MARILSLGRMPRLTRLHRRYNARRHDQTHRANRGALADLRVLELGTLIAGPFCGQLLGDMGAEVIKIEAPGQGDPMRHLGPPAAR